MTKPSGSLTSGLIIPSLVTSNAQKINTTLENNEISSPWHLTFFICVHTLLHRVVQCIFSTNTLMNKKKQKGKLKYTSNMRSQNEVIQVRCVEINSRSIITTATTTGDERDEAQGTKPQRESRFILSSYWSPPKAAGPCLVPSVISPFSPPASWICDQPGSAGTCSDAHSKALGQAGRCLSLASEICRSHLQSRLSGKY